MKPITPPVLSDKEQLEWLVQHTPHRIRAVLPRLPMKAPWQLDWALGAVSVSASICWQQAAHEGRHSSMRWLLEYIGIIKSKSGYVRPAPLRDHDTRIDALKGGLLFAASRPSADFLADIWLGCTQATGHPTQGSNHPDITYPRLAEALHVAIDHLQSTVYDARRLSLHAIALQLTAVSRR